MPLAHRLLGCKGCGSAVVEAAFAVAKLPLEYEEVDYGAGSPTRERLLSVNPLGQVPTLVLPDGTVLTESLAILLTLADRHPEAGLLPEPGSAERAVALRWMALAAGEIYPCVTRADYPERFSADPAHGPAIRVRAVQMAREIWRIIEAEAAPAPFLLGGRFSAADLHLAVLSRWMEGEAWMPANCPRLEALARAVATRDRAGAAWRRHFDVPPPPPA
jgi:GST-like protein